ncbi:hypothetical protein D1007_19069 [Hordeum vulgare]|nr:hypothetical protein D1007_19069 [Hordeum vulgare]
MVEVEEACELTLCEADLWALKQQLALTSSELVFERERLKAQDRDVTVGEATYNRRVENIQGDANTWVEKDHEEYRNKVKMQDSSFTARHVDLHHEIGGLKDALTLAEGWGEAVLKAHAAIMAKLALLQRQVGGAAPLVERATDEAKEARWQQHLRSKMFRWLERRARRALGSIFGASISSPLVPDDVGYLDFFTEVMERLEAGAREVGVLIEEESRDLLSQALTCVLSNLLHADPT